MPRGSKDEPQPKTQPAVQPRPDERPPVRIPLEPDYVTKEQDPPDVEKRDKD